MTPDPRPPDTLLREARTLDRARDYPALVRLLESRPRAEVVADPAVGFLLADVLRRVGRGAEALEVLDALEPALGLRGNDRLHRRRLNLRGSLHFEAGRVDDARADWMTQLDDATEAEDEEFVARANNNLGVVATLHGRLAEALGHYGRAVASYQRLGYARGLGQSHHNLGITYREMGFPREADHHFRHAERLARDGGSDDELARVRQERALLLYLLGDPDLARATARRALGTYLRLEDPAGEGEVHRVLGMVELGEDRLDEAGEHLDTALDRAVATGAILLEAETREARAALLAARGAPSDAVADEETRAGALFASIGAPGWGRRIRDRVRSVAARAAYPPPAS